MDKAKEIQANLSLEHPSFIKVMQRSHVSNPFYTCPPMKFYQKHLPRTDETIVFELENGKSYEVKFLGSKCAFSGGWRGFSIAEKLRENDVLVFHLIESCKFKVYVVRASGLASVDKAPIVVEIDDFATEREAEKKRICERDKKSTNEKSAAIVVGDVKDANFIGVRKKASGRYGAEIKILHRTVWLGTFDTAEEAALAYDAAARGYRGSKANTNFPLNQSPRHSATTVGSSLLSPKHHCDMKNVYSESVPVDKAPMVIEIDDFETEKEIGKEGTCERDKKRPKLFSQENFQEKVKANVSSKKTYTRSNNSNSSKEGFQPSEFVSDFKSFKITVDDMTIELPQQVRADYFKLCCSQKSYLHCHLIKDIEPELAASVISGTVNISNKIRESKISTPQDKIMYWNKALDGFELFGMNIGLIRARLNRLSGLTLDLKRYEEAKNEHDRVEEKIVELKKEKRRLEEEIEGMEKGVVEHKAMYEQEANAPW